MQRTFVRRVLPAVAAVALAVAAAQSITADDHQHAISAATADGTNPKPASTTLEHRLTSEDGRFRVAADPLAEGATAFTPGGRTETNLEVVDQLTGEVRTYPFNANLEPEAFSPDGRRLFVIDHRPPEAPVSYRVAVIDLEAGTVAEVLGPDKQPLDEDMRGSGRQQVWSRDGAELYTLYVRQYHDHDGHERDPDGAPPEAAFVHVLGIDSGWALCVDLPEGVGLGPAGSAAIMLGDAGDAEPTLRVVDHALGLVIPIERVESDGGAPQFVVGNATPIN